MLEFMLMGKGGIAGVFPNSGPGTKKLKFGNTNAGYFGEVTAAEFLTASEVGSYAKLRMGVDLEANPVWLKFVYKGNFLFIAKKPVRSGITWNSLYESGAVYGEDTNGSALGPQTTNQFLVAKKSGLNFKIRLSHADTVDPSALVTAVSDNILSKDCEWNQLLYRVSSGLSSQYNEAWASFTAAELGYTVQPTLCMEHSTTADSVITKGNATSDKVGVVGVAATSGWRPVLEMINLDAMLLSVVDERSSAQGLMAADGVMYSFDASGDATYVIRAENIVASPSVLQAVGDFSSSNADYVFRTDDTLAKPDTLMTPSNMTFDVTF